MNTRPVDDGPLRAGRLTSRLLIDLVTTSAAVGSTRSRTAKIDELASLLRRLAPAEIAIAVSYLTGAVPQGPIGVGWATSSTVEGTADRPSVTIGELDAAMAELATVGGPGSQAHRRDIIATLSRRLVPDEAAFVRLLLVGELRQGALAGVMIEAIGRASGVPAAAVRRAAMLTGDLPSTARVALVDGREAIEATGLVVGVGVEPMLASTATDVAEALAGTGPASVEWKLDGIRLQVHRDGDDVRLYTRNLNDITGRLPAVVALVRSLPATRLVLDGEAIGNSVGFFDILHLDGRDLLDVPLAERRNVLASIEGLPLIPSTATDDPVVAQGVLDDALAQGHEGVMVKDLTSPYAAGRRGAAWRKIKPVHTLDLVVLAVEWGSGRRRGTLSNLHLGALDADGEPVMVGKTFKGLTDELLAWQTERFLGLATSQDDHVVHVRPEQVVEIAVDGAQVSTRYAGGLALRFARVRRYRPDKAADDADTLDAVRALLPR